MTGQGAPRLSLRPLLRFARVAVVMMALLAGVPGASAQTACTDGDGAWVARLCYLAEAGHPIYGHAVLGDTPEWSALQLYLGPRGAAAAGARVLRWSPAGFPNGSLIFEDTAPRLADVDGDGQPEAVVVESSASQGARLAIYELIPAPALLAATPYIGRRNRWLAPAGIADFNGDGWMEIAYVDRPHLARTLRVWSLQPEGLRQIAELPGVSNHRIGESFITGGLRDCGSGPELVLSDAGWRNVITVNLRNSEPDLQVYSPFSAENVTFALSCR